MRHHVLTRRLPVAAGLAAAGLVAATPAFAGAATGAATGAGHARSDDPMTVYSGEIPAGATATVKAVYPVSGTSIVSLHVTGLKPDTRYGAHAHVNPCGLTGAAAGPHFQHVVDPVQPSVDPAYANPENEIWLDLTTNAAGNGVAHTTVPWQFTADRRARSVIVHEKHTATGPGQAGTAGARLACIDVDF